jgi:hypothetical protein
VYYNLSDCSSEREREREREDKESGEVVRDTTFGEGARNYISGFVGSQAVPARPSGRSNAYDRGFDGGRATLERNFDVTTGRAAIS